MHSRERGICLSELYGIPDEETAASNDHHQTMLTCDRADIILYTSNVHTVTVFESVWIWKDNIFVKQTTNIVVDYKLHPISILHIVKEEGVWIDRNRFIHSKKKTVNRYLLRCTKYRPILKNPCIIVFVNGYYSASEANIVLLSLSRTIIHFRKRRHMSSMM